MPIAPQTSRRVLATPRARKRANLLGIDLASVQGSGLGGRILAADVRGVERTSGLSAMRRTIAERTALSARTIPHFYLETEVDATGIVEFRRARANAVRLSVTDILLRAQAFALVSCPDANSVWTDNTIQRLATAAVGLVVSVPSGLYVPIVRNADRVTLGELAEMRAHFVQEARAGQLDPACCVGDPGGDSCSTSLTNLGVSRVDNFSPLVHVGQSSMLAAGRMVQRPWIVEGRVEARFTIRLTLAVDHRVMDGMIAATYLDLLCGYLESPY